MKHRLLWLLIILLAAAFLRLAAIDQIPPGLTHDEADHGVDAWGVVNGIRPLYFTVGYGREPFFDYSTALLMSFLGPTFLAGRLTAVFFSLLALAASYAWVARAFDRQAALLTAAGLAVGFWPVMTGRQALRSVTLPAMFALAVALFWAAVIAAGRPGKAVDGTSQRRGLGLFLLAGMLLGLSFYTYVPARVLWVVFPALLVYLAARRQSAFRRIWAGTALMLLVGLLVSLPLLLFLANNPEAEARIEQLDEPLAAAGKGDYGPLLENVAAGLKVIALEGDDQWRYNIPGRPVLSWPMIPLFLLGLGLAAWGAFAPRKYLREGQLEVGGGAGAFFALAWLAAGVSPVLATGRSLSTTRLIGAQPVLYLFPALGLAFLLQRRRLGQLRWLPVPVFAAVMLLTGRDYFQTWANAPEVRVQYETTTVSAMAYLNESGRGAVAVSTTTPGQFHSPAVALLTLDNPAVELRWFNGQHSLLMPQAEPATLMFSGFAALDPALAPYLVAELEETLPLRPSDVDRPLSVYSANGPAQLALWQDQFAGQLAAPTGLRVPVAFGSAVVFLGYDLQTPRPAPGEEVRLATLWRVQRPLPEAVFFTQVLAPDGQVLAQDDRLDVPGEGWISGDIFIQLHRFRLPESTGPGAYPLLIGIYTRPDLQRVPVRDGERIAADHLQLSDLVVGP